MLILNTAGLDPESSSGRQDKILNSQFSILNSQLKKFSGTHSDLF